MNYVLKKGNYETELLNDKDIDIINSINDTYRKQNYRPFCMILDDVYSRYSGKTAVICGSEEYTYSQLRDSSLKIAGAIRKKTESCKRIAMILPKCCMQVVIAAGCLYSGITYTPIEYDSPAARLGECIKLSGVQLVITDEVCMERINSFRKEAGDEKYHEVFGEAEIITCDELAEISAEPSPAEECGYDDIGMIIFTSGSTGKPKGIKIKYGSILNILECVWRVCGYTPSDKLIGVTNICHDLGNYDIVTMILLGGTLIYPENVKDTGSWVELMNRYGVTQWSTVPTIFGMLLDTLEAMDAAVPTMKNILIGGEFVKPDMYIMAKKYLPNAVLYTDGGPTESTILNILNRVTDEEYASGKLPYGIPTDNTQYFILDEQLRVVPLNEKGLIYNSGDSLAEGYLDEKLTEKSFIIHPTMNIRMYNTGDLGCYRENGKIDIFGRIDNQVKISGKRIDLEEIELKLEQCDKVKRALAAVIGTDSVKSIGVYIIPEGEFSADEIKSFAVSNLPDYMVPSVWEFTDEFPRLPNGKINRNALKFTGTENKAEMTNIESELLEIEKELLGLDSIGLDDKFFESGGHSALLVKLMMLIKKKLGIEVSLIKLMEYPDIRQLAAYLENGNGGDAAEKQQENSVNKRRDMMKKRMERRRNG